MAGHARFMDITIGRGTHHLKDCPHTFIGFHIQASDDVLDNNLGTVRNGDMTIHLCPHCKVGFSMTSSGDVFAEGAGIHRIGDLVNETCGVGITISGSPDVFSNGGEFNGGEFIYAPTPLPLHAIFGLFKFGTGMHFGD